jgi:glutaredoxin 3
VKSRPAQYCSDVRPLAFHSATRFAHVAAFSVMRETLLRPRHVGETRVVQRIHVTGDDEARAWLVDATGQRTVPQIFIGGEAIGGYDELAALDKSGELAKKVG